MAKHGYQKNSIRAKVNHELWKGVRFDFSSSLQMTKVEGGGSLGGKLKQTILQPVTCLVSGETLDCGLLS